MSIIADIKINIMLVDDMVINRLILEDLILQAFNNSSKIPITHAANGEEALAILKDNYDYDYDLIFMDVNMPLINGYEASKFIKEKISPDIAVYIISGNDILGEFDKISQAKADGYLEKPIDIKKIEKIIREIFHKKITREVEALWRTKELDIALLMKLKY